MQKEIEMLKDLLEEIETYPWTTDFNLKEAKNILNNLEKETNYYQRISGILFKNEDNYEYWHDFSLTKEEEIVIMNILERHQTEGGSIIGSQIEIIEEVSENAGISE